MQVMEKKCRILMVDDEPDFLIVTRAWLKPRFELYAFEDGAGLLRNIDALKPDLLILDICLPGLDGFELCREIALENRYHSLPILFLTACQGPSYLAKGVAAGGTSYLTKPIGREELLAKIKEMLGAPRQALSGRGL
jgi:DNA-binding response OmpR family regulator